MLSKRFPYALYYTLADDIVSVHAILDCRQDPGQIEERLNQERTRRWSLLGPNICRYSAFGAGKNGQTLEKLSEAVYLAGPKDRDSSDGASRSTTSVGRQLEREAPSEHRAMSVPLVLHTHDSA